MSVPDRRPCVCGHAKYAHLGGGRCDNGSKRCRCDLFRECSHPAVSPWLTTYPEPTTRYVCAVCRQAMPAAVETDGAA